MRTRLLLVALIPLLSATAQDSPGGAYGLAGLAGGGGKEVKVSLQSEATALAPGKSFRVGIQLKHSPHWHSYWFNSGGFSLPTEVKWELPDGFTAGPLRWPTPEIVELDSLKSYAFSDTVHLLAEITPPASAAPGSRIKIAAKVNGQACKDSCQLFEETVATEIPVAAEAAVDAKTKAVFDDAAAAMSRPLTAWKAEAVEGKGEVALTVQPVGENTAEPAEAYFFSFKPDIDGQAVQPVAKDGKGLRLTLKRSDDESAKSARLAGIVFTKGGWIKGDPKSHSWEIDVPIAGGAAQSNNTGQPATNKNEGAGGQTASSRFTPEEIDAASLLYDPSKPILQAEVKTNLWTALVGAFLGGILLNLMPCVFPVLGLKIMGFTQQAGDDPRKIRRHGLVFTLGVAVSMWILAGTLIAIKMASKQELNWGAQLGNPVFVAAIVAVFFLFGLNMAGVFEIGTSLVGVGGELQQKQGYLGSFFSGILTTVIATPCSGPFLGAAISYAINEPPLRAFVIFTVFALGIAAPYLVFSFFPALLSRLPRPGMWMETFKKVMAFAMFGAAGFFLRSFGTQTGAEGLWWLLMALVVLGVAAFCYGNWSLPHKPALARHGLGKVLPVLIASGAIWMARDAVAMKAGASVVESDGKVVWEQWKPGLVELARQKKMRLWVDYTADWCLTCKANEKRVLADSAFLARLKELDVVPVKVDLTKNDPVLARDLARTGRSNIPVWLFYPADESKPPVLLEELISPAEALRALEKTAR